MDIDIKGFLFDLDGVFCIDNIPIPGSVRILNHLNINNIPYRFLTNTTTRSRYSLFKKLNQLGFPIIEEHIISASYAGVLKLRELGSPTCQLILKEDAQRDYSEFIIDNSNPEYIVIGDLDRDWNFDIINKIFNKVINGAIILALHKGKYFKVKENLQIDSGAFIKGIEYAASTESILVGKPEKNFFNLAIDDINIPLENLVMVGDDIINDIGGAQACGVKSILVETGKFRKDLIDKSTIVPDLMIPSINSLIDLLD